MCIFIEDIEIEDLDSEDILCVEEQIEMDNLKEGINE